MTYTLHITAAQAATPEEAWDNASRFIEQCAEIVSDRIRKKGEA